MRFYSTRVSNCHYETFDIGSDLGTPVSANYASPCAFSGKIDAIKVDIR
jgi:arylsulfatase